MENNPKHKHLNLTFYFLRVYIFYDVASYLSEPLLHNTVENPEAFQ